MSKYKISFMTSSRVTELSKGEVKSPSLIETRTAKPIIEGLLCPRIFGTMKDNICLCSTKPQPIKRGEMCSQCGIVIESSLEHRNRMGHVSFPFPLVNPIAFEHLNTLFDLTPFEFERLLTGAFGEPKQIHFFGWEEYEEGKIFIRDGENIRQVKCVIEPRFSQRTPYSTSRGVYIMVQQIDWNETYDYLKKTKRPKSLYFLAKMCVENSFDPKKLFLTSLPIPPVLHRPVLQQDGKKDLIVGEKNELYKKVLGQIRRWTNLKSGYSYMMKIRLLLDWESLLIQKSVNQILVFGFDDKGRKRHLESLTEDLSGKEGLLREKLLGKRIDFSARSVISPGPHLNIDEAGIPRKMAYQVFWLHITQKLISWGYKYSRALKAVKAKSADALAALEEVAKQRRILLNRQPTLHRIGMLSFKVILHDGYSILLHPMVCAPYNADFDGDQMALYVPMYEDTCKEMKTLMEPQKNLLSPLNSELAIGLSHEMIIGVYYLTKINSDKRPYSVREANVESLLQHKRITYQDPLLVYTNKGKRHTTAGRLLVENLFHVPVEEVLVKNNLIRLLSASYDVIGPDALATSMNTLKDVAFQVVTQIGFSLGMDDLFVPSTKAEVLQDADRFISEQQHLLAKGAITSEEKYERVVRHWFRAIKDLQTTWLQEAGENNPLVTMLRTGARVKMSQVSQLVVAKGMQATASGSIIEHPVRSSLLEKVNTFDYFTTCYGARKSMADKKMATPRSGYLARRLVNATRDFYIVEEDCGYAYQGIELPESRAVGRVRHDGLVVGPTNSSEYVTVRSPIYCRARGGICAACYGIDQTTRRRVKVGSPVGIIAAQSLTEPCTQMTMRSFHTSGAAELGDSPLTVRSSVDGVVAYISYSESTISIGVQDFESVKTYFVHKSGTTILVSVHDTVHKRQPLATYTSADLTNEDIGGKLYTLDAYYECRELRGTQAVVARQTGQVAVTVSGNAFTVFINGEEQGTVENSPLFVYNGEYVRRGQFLSYGEAPLLHLRKDFSLFCQVFVERLLFLYAEEGIESASVHVEMICRGMTECTFYNDKLGLYRFGDPGERIVLGVTVLGKRYPSWLKAISFGYVKQGLANAALEESVTYDLPSERIMMGQFPLIDILVKKE